MFHHKCNPTNQPPSSYRNNHRFQIGNGFDNLNPNCRLASNDIFILIGMNKNPVILFRKFLSKDYASVTRFFITNSARVWVFGVFTAYYFMYNANDWSIKGNWKMSVSRPAIQPGDPEWPHGKRFDKPKGSDYWTSGFENSPI